MRSDTRAHSQFRTSDIFCYLEECQNLKSGFNYEILKELNELYQVHFRKLFITVEIMWAITTFFNPVKYKRRLQNFYKFRSALSVPLIVIELSFDGSFEISMNDADIVIHLNGGAILWQKECLLNIALQSVPQGVEQIAWLDCDIIFENQNWESLAIEKLKKYPIIQLFSELVGLEKNESELFWKNKSNSVSRFGVVSSIHADKVRITDLNGYPPGGAWAARRDLLVKHGFYDAMIIGGGDRAMVCAMYGRFNDAIKVLCLNQNRKIHYLQWAIPYYRTVNGMVGYIPGRIFHMWHGDIVHRVYKERHKALELLGLDIEKQLYKNQSGVWNWVDCNDPVKNLLAKYFSNRLEDG